MSVKLSLVQILVIVANTQMWSGRTEVWKGSAWTAIERGSVDPKKKANALYHMIVISYINRISKGNQVNIPEPIALILRSCGRHTVTFLNLVESLKLESEFSFLVKNSNPRKRFVRRWGLWICIAFRYWNVSCVWMNPWSLELSYESCISAYLLPHQVR